jgi:glucose-6-phosphate isomerase|tara:strand:- start:1175 stop:2344 length:1170 start_codon:yes stop_codon:yes gene_type:complete
MLTKKINFKNFKIKSKKNNIKKIFQDLKKNYLKGQVKVLKSLSRNYQYSFNYKLINKYKKFKNFRVIGMGGSILGSEAIYHFLNHKIKKNFSFINNLQNKLEFKGNKKDIVNIIISKSGNTLETISNSNILIKNNKKNIFVVENNENYLNNLASQIKADVIEHKNYLGGRYSVLSEVGMLPAELMGLKEKKFKRLNYLIHNKSFVDQLINNVSSTLSLIKKGKYLSVILNYDHKSENLFKWYQQLIGESLGKKSKGILPLISSMPRDGHSLMQFYLDGPKNNFYTFFNVLEKNSTKINNKILLKSHSYLKNKNLQNIRNSQMLATQKIFKRKKIPFRNFEILERSEQTIGEIFCFFILETILLGRALRVNPFDQPSVELIKRETKKILF